MISGRILIMTCIIIVLLCAGLFLYTEYRNQKFTEQLPTPQPKQVLVKAIVNETREPINSTTPNNHSWQADERKGKTAEINTPIADTEKHSDASQSDATKIETELGAEDAEHRSQAEIDTIFDDAFDFFDEFSVFGSINVEATRVALEELLRDLHGDDPKISEFLGHWDTTSRILSLRAKYNETGAIDAQLREKIFEMKPTEVLPKAFELGTELIQPSEVIVTKRNEWLQEWVELANKAEVAHIAAAVAREAIDNGEITPQEAEGFVEEVSGLDVEFKVANK